MNTPSEIAVECARRFHACSDPKCDITHQQAGYVQDAIDKATAGMVPIDDVRPLLESVNPRQRINANDAFLAKHGEKLK